MSPCPNDTFIFFGLLNGKVDPGVDMDPVVEDVEELNSLVLEGALHVSKVSFHLYSRVVRDYVLLDSGAALGRGCGPLLVAREPLDSMEIEKGTIAIPGMHTTAALLLRLFVPGASRLVPMNFASIPSAVASGRVEAGVIIHESRFTYQEKGLLCVKDLGAWWEEHSGLPIPLGGIVARRDLDSMLLKGIAGTLRQSVEYAAAHREETVPFVRRYAQEMDESVLERHIGLYVNDFTLELGQEGRQAVEVLFRKGFEAGVLPDTRGLPLVFQPDGVI